jgi:hypothetical protein
VDTNVSRSLPVLRRWHTLASQGLWSLFSAWAMLKHGVEATDRKWMQRPVEQGEASLPPMTI